MTIENIPPIPPASRLEGSSTGDDQQRLVTLARQAAADLRQPRVNTAAPDNKIVPDKDGWANAKFFLTSPDIELDDEDDLIKMPAPMPFQIDVCVKFKDWAERAVNPRQGSASTA